MTELYEILVPTVNNEGKPFRTRYHRCWDTKVRSIAGGLTVMHPARGQWVAHDGQLFVERMIPVRIACTAEQIEEIAAWTQKYYSQEAVMYYRLSDKVFIRDFRCKQISKKTSDIAD